MKSAESKSPSRRKKKPAKKRAAPGAGAFPVVAIGASAGGLEAYKEFFEALPADTGMAFVLIQHLDPTHHSLLAEILSKSSRIPVHEVKAGTTIAPNCVYVIPPDAFMAIKNGAFVLTPRKKESGQSLSVNFFMRSLAEEYRSRAIGVILSGTGADGTLGLENIKAEGGITFAQDPQTAKYDGMPQSALQSGGVDFVLAPKAIAKELHRIQQHPYVQQDVVAAEEAGGEEPAAAPSEEKGFLAILDQLRRSSGVDFRQYKPTTIHRRALRRAMILKLDSLGQYAGYLREHPEEAARLYDDVLIPVTSFFRDLEAFETMKNQVYPAITKDKSNKETIRMWAPGCSTGEETYSLAMTLLEFLGEKAPSYQIQIFGTDLNEKGIQKARTGMYRESIAEEISPERMQRFFVKTDEGYRVNKAVRDMCVFARHDLANDPPFSQMNVVACRNLLIYLQPVLQKKIIPILHYALKTSGFLFLGGTESVASFPDLFSSVDKKHRLYSKRATTSRLHYDFTQKSYLPSGKSYVPEDSEKSMPPRIDFDVQVEADRAVLKSHTPPGVVINRELEVVQFRGQTAPYLAPAPGKPSLNVLKLARNGLSVEIRSLVGAARKKGALVRREGVPFDESGRRHILDLSVLPLGQKGAGEAPYFVVLFEDVTARLATDGKHPDKHSGGAAKGSSADRQEVQRLKRELADTQDTLRLASESEDSLKEEFQSANEEILSANEELQSTNEELETSKEELQSANEELSTLNAELGQKNNELHDLNNDISNFLNSTRIPVVMLDRQLRIRRVTPMADTLLKARPTDIGRPISDIRLKVDVPHLESMIAAVLETLQPVEREVRGPQGHWYSLSILPYRTQDNKIDGVVLALQDIDPIKAANTQLKRTTEFLRGVVDTVANPLLVLDAQLRIVLANEPFLRTFQVATKEAVNCFFYNLGGGQWNIPELRTLLEEALPKRKSVRNFSVEREFENLGSRTMLINAEILSSLPDEEPMILLAIEDISERKRMELSAGRLAAIVESSDDGIISMNLDGVIETWNTGAERMFGHTRQQAVGKNITIILPPDRLHEEPVILATIRRGEHIQHHESIRRRKDGSLLNVSITASPVLSATGQIIGASKIEHDITVSKMAEGALIRSEKLAAAGRLAATLAHEINNPLQAVTNLVSLWRQSPNDEQSERYATMVDEELRRVNHLTQQSLNFYRESAAPSSIDLAAIIRSVLEVYAKRLSAKRIHLTAAYSQGETTVTSYPGEVRQVFSTLLVNALEAVPDGGKISVRVRKAHHRNDPECNGVLIMIADNGVGVPRNSLGRIFEPFYTTKLETGTGLGLWVANGIVSRLGGSIRVRSSVQPGKSGTCFSVFLPNRPPPRPAESRT